MGRKEGKMEEFDEKRMFERFNMLCKGHLTKDSEEIDMRIKDVSGKGLGFLTSKLLEVGDRLMIRIEMKRTQELVDVTGEVVWWEPYDPSTYSVGFKLDMTSWTKISKILAQ